MFSKILIGGVTAAAIIGAGGAALAATGSGATSGSPSAQPSTGTHAGTGKQGSKSHRAHGLAGLLRRVDHADIVVHTKKHGDMTYQLIRGTVSAVSSSSITVVSADKTTETFGVTSSTKVSTRSATKGAKPTTATIGAVSKGDHVFVAGLGAAKPVARRVLDRGTK